MVGRTPGIPKSTSVISVLGSLPNALGAEEKIFVVVLSSTCTSSPSTGSYCATVSSKLGRLVVTCGLLPRSRRRVLQAPDHRTAPRWRLPVGVRFHRRPGIPPHQLAVVPGCACPSASRARRCHRAPKRRESRRGWPELWPRRRHTSTPDPRLAHPAGRQL